MTFTPPLHFVGIGGIGMSALARILHARGILVSGCTDCRSDVTDRLQSEGIPVSIGHAAEHLDGVRTVVITSAVGRSHPEVVAAERTGVPLVRRGSLLALLMAGGRGIAVAGTHGKTTTTAMVAAILEASGADPTVVVGGELPRGSNARAGTGPWFVAESDESDGSFLELRPEIAVVTNVENDHVTSSDAFESLVASFATFLARVPPNGVAAVGIDEPRSAEIARRPRRARTRTFGFSAHADVRAVDVRYRAFGSSFGVMRGGDHLGAASLSLPGAMNVQNALAALSVVTEVGVPFAAAADALSAFRGVRRRFDILARNERMTVVDDYAHHPTAVEATIAAARAGWDGDVIVAFEPHRYSRTAYLAREFARALHGADRVVLAPIYAASEAALPGVDASLIGNALRGMGGDVSYVNDASELPAYLLQNAPHGALILMLGAGGITLAAHTLADLVNAAEQAVR